VIIYDLEIVKAIPTKEAKVDGIEYCNGWNDHANMGVAVICAYETKTQRYRVFTKENWNEFADLYCNSGEKFIGFNSISFDNAVLAANGIVEIAEKDSYDLLREIWRSAGLGPVFKYPSHVGYGLEAVATINGLPGKTGSGEIAPIDWQRGKYGKVIDYCLTDVWLTWKLIEKIQKQGYLISPLYTHPKLDVLMPTD
jgi:Predicted 3'-5' exonuclease related to the exonuclease domain of PolB